MKCVKIRDTLTLREHTAATYRPLTLGYAPRAW